MNTYEYLKTIDLQKIYLIENDDETIAELNYVTEPGTGPAYLLNMDSVSRLLLSTAPPKKIKAVYIKD